MTLQRGPVELDAAQCRALMATAGTGRVGVSTPLGPQVLPVGYAVLADAVLLWTSPYSLVARCAPGATVAFQVDQADAVDLGWSVQAHGRAEPLDDASAHELLSRLPAPPRDAPWPEPGRRLYLRLRWTELTGHATAAPAAEHRVRRAYTAGP